MLQFKSSDRSDWSDTPRFFNLAALVLGAGFLLVAASVQAQPPPAPVTPAPAAVPGTAPSSGPRRRTPLQTPGQQNTNSIIVPSDADLVPIAPSPAAANTSPEQIIPAGEIDFRGVDLEDVLKIYAELVNKTLLRPATLGASKIVLRTQTPLTKREAIQALDAVLGLNGVVVIPFGDKFAKVTQSQTGNMEAAPFSHLTASQLPEFGQFVTHVVQLKYAKPSEMVPILTPFQKMSTAILPIESSGILVLRDFSENVKRMLEMIAAVDVSLPSEFSEEVIPIKYALAGDIASALNSLSSGGGGATVGTRSSGAGTTGMRSSGFGSRSGAGGMGGVGGFGGQGGMGGYPGQNQSPFGQQAQTQPGAAPGGTFQNRLQSIINRAATSGEFQILGQTKIIADERTNSLLVFASKEDMKMIKEIVGKLDIVLAQVLIEAVIIQVSLTDSRNLGVAYTEKQSHGIGNYFSGIGAINPGSALTANSFVSGVGSNASGTLSGGGLSYLGSFGNDLDVTMTAVAADSRAKILQRPRIQTSNAKQASLFVGESRPYPTSSYYGGGSYGGYSSIQQLQIGVSIDVTPLINPDGLVVMDIHSKIDSFEGNVTIANVGDVPITSSKEAQASVAVRDHDTIILGGLIETTKSHNASGVPFLKDIPVLGYLFRTDAKTEDRNELIVLIRPTVLPTPEVAALTATAEKNKMPGVRSTEHEINLEESKRIRAMEKEFKDEK